MPLPHRTTGALYLRRTKMSGQNDVSKYFKYTEKGKTGQTGEAGKA
jgi:hypothetical protein